MKKFQITDLDVNEANAILSVLGDLPSKTGIYPLFMKVRMQLEAQNSDQQSGEQPNIITE
jgi:hypothetical protein